MRDECNTCKRESLHGGQCRGKSGTVPCLAYAEDPRGRREWLRGCRLSVSLGKDIPKLHEPSAGWNMRGINKTIHLTHIDKVEWHTTKKGLQGIVIMGDIWYWSHENGEVPPKKPKLRLIKTGG